MKPIIEAHRGYSGVYPENTLLAFEKAVACGAPSIELDVHVTKDGEIIVMHDANVKRTTNGEGEISALTLAEIKKLDAGQWKGFSGVTVPTLAEALALTDSSNVHYNVEVKRFGDDGIAARKLYKLLIDHAPTDGPHVVSSFDLQALLDVRKAGTKIPLCILGSKAYELLPIAKDNKFQWIHSHFSTVDQAFVDAAHEAGIKVMIWTVEVADYQKYAAMGVDKICTNWCKEMLALQ